MRIYLYLLAGLTSALIGWNIGQFFLSDLNIIKIFPFPEIILFPCIAISLAIGMILNEIFISNPTRISLCLKKSTRPLLIALGLGMGIGLASGGITTILLLPDLKTPAMLVRVLGWLLIGLAVGLAEGLSWRWQSIEAGDPMRFWKRFKISIIGATVASLVAAVIFEVLRKPISESTLWKNFEDPIGFSLLGILLALAFSLTNSPSYMTALRAGTGFEYTSDMNEGYDDDEDFNYQKYQETEEEDLKDTLPIRLYPRINHKELKFVTYAPNGRRIEEGLSIQLPSGRKMVELKIGSAADADIYIPDIPDNVATLKIEKRQTSLVPTTKYYQHIYVNGKRTRNDKPIILKHNNLITFITKDDTENTNEKKTYRFIYYNRFLDPQG